MYVTNLFSLTREECDDGEDWSWVSGFSLRQPVPEFLQPVIHQVCTRSGHSCILLNIECLLPHAWLGLELRLACPTCLFVSYC